MAKSITIKADHLRQASKAYTELYADNGLQVFACKSGKFEIKCGSTHKFAKSLQEVQAMVDGLALHDFPSSGQEVVGAIREKLGSQFRLELRAAKADGKDEVVHTVEGSLERIADQMMAVSPVEINKMAAGVRYSMPQNMYGGEYMMLVPMSDALCELSPSFAEPQLYEKQQFAKGQLLHGLCPITGELINIIVAEAYPNGGIKDQTGKVYSEDEVERLQFAIGRESAEAEPDFHEPDDSFYEASDVPSYNPIGVVKEQAPILGSLKNYDGILSASAGVISDFFRTVKGTYLDRSSLNKVTVTAVNADGQATDGVVEWNCRIGSDNYKRSSIVTLPLEMVKGSIDLGREFVTSTLQKFPLTAEGLKAHLGMLAEDDPFRMPEPKYRHASIVRADAGVDELMAGVKTAGGESYSDVMMQQEAIESSATPEEAVQKLKDMGYESTFSEDPNGPIETIEECVNRVWDLYKDPGNQAEASKKTVSNLEDKSVEELEALIDNWVDAMAHMSDSPSTKAEQTMVGRRIREAESVLQRKKKEAQASKKTAGVVDELLKTLELIGSQDKREYPAGSAEYQKLNELSDAEFADLVDRLGRLSLMIEYNNNDDVFEVFGVGAEHGPLTSVESKKTAGWVVYDTELDREMDTFESKALALATVDDLAAEGYTGLEVREAEAEEKEAMLNASVKQAAGDAVQYYYQLRVDLDIDGAKEDGLDLDSKTDEVTEAAMKIEDNVISWMDNNIGHTNTEGHSSNDELLGSVFVIRDNKEARALVLSALEDEGKESLRTSSGTLPFDPFHGVDSQYAKVFMVDLSFSRVGNQPEDNTPDYSDEEKFGMLNASVKTAIKYTGNVDIDFEDAAVIPEMVIETAVERDHEVPADKVQEITQELIKRFNATYSANPEFGKKILGANGRDTLYAFVEHWLKARHVQRSEVGAGKVPMSEMTDIRPDADRKNDISASKTIGELSEGAIVHGNEGYSIVKRDTNAPYKLFYAFLGHDLPEDYDKTEVVEVLDDSEDHLEASKKTAEKFKGGFEGCVEHFMSKSDFKPKHAGDTKREAAEKLCAYIKNDVKGSVTDVQRAINKYCSLNAISYPTNAPVPKCLMSQSALPSKRADQDATDLDNLFNADPFTSARSAGEEWYELSVEEDPKGGVTHIKSFEDKTQALDAYEKYRKANPEAVVFVDRWKMEDGEDGVPMPVDVIADSASEKPAAKKVATGEADQDYDTAVYDKVVDQLAKAGFPGATHKEFDKYQGIYLNVPGVDKFWTADIFYSGTRSDKPESKKYKAVELMSPTEGSVSANPGDYFMMEPGDVFEDHTLTLSLADGSEKVIENPKKSDLPKSEDIVPSTFTYEKGTETTHYILTGEDNPELSGEVFVSGDNVDASLLISAITEAGFKPRGGKGKGRGKKQSGFMEPMIEPGKFVIVDGPMGGETVSADLISEDELQQLQHQLEDHDEASLEGLNCAMYFQNEEIYDIEVKDGWVAYLSAPGYMDRTENTFFNTEAEAREFLKEEYPEEAGEESVEAAWGSVKAVSTKRPLKARRKTAEEKSEAPILSAYDQSKVYENQVEDLVELMKESPEEFGVAPGTSDAEIRAKAEADATDDSDIYQMAWDDEMGVLDDAIANANATSGNDGWWDVEGRNMGWQQLKIENHEDFFKMFPKTQDFSYELRAGGGGKLEVTIWHHDAPTGEYRTLVPAKEHVEESEL